VTLPAGATERTTFEGIRTTKRTVRMIKEARFLFKLRGGGASPGISQGGWSTSVGASKGSHDRDALDFRTRLFSSTRRLLWEWCVWEVGFASWRRTYLAGIWPAHDHALPKNGWLSDVATRQIWQWNQGDNALKSDLDYPRILSSGFVARTWEKYLAIKPGGTVDLSGVVAAFKASERADPSQNEGDNDIQQIQKALNHYLDSKLATDGVAGPATRGVYATYQARLYGVRRWSPQADGIPGSESLAKLGFKVIA
jgi:hypothetical protein